MRLREFIDRYSLSAAAYTVVAVLSALIEWATFFILQNALDPWTAAISAFFVATLGNYLLSRGIAFNSNRTSRNEIVLLFALSGLAFLFNFGAFAFLYAIIGMTPIIAKIIGTGTAFGINYAFRQFVIFSPH